MLVVVFKLLSRLPLSVVQALGAVLGMLVVLASASFRGRMRANIQQAGLDADRLLWPAARAAGMQSLETAWVWLRPREDLLCKIDWVDRGVLDAALAEGPPLVMLTPHLGSFEAIAQAYVLLPQAAARPMTALYRVPRKDVLRPLVEGARAKEGLRLAPADTRGVRRLLRALKERQVLGILPDQVPAHGDGVWAPFFGRSAYTMTLPARLALGGGAIVLVLAAERLPRGGGFRIHVARLAEPLTGDTQADAARLNRGIEAMILRFPAQYLWGYNRYKKPASAAPPPSSAGSAAA